MISTDDLQELQKLILKICEGEKEKILFKDWALEWLKTYKRDTVKENTFVGTYENPIKKHLIPYFGEYYLTDIKPIDIRRFLNDQSQTYAYETIKKFKACLSSIFEAAIENDLCSKNPVSKNLKICSNIPPPKKQAYSFENYITILDFAYNHKNSGGIDIFTMLTTGISRSELLGLKWENVDFTQRTLVIKDGTVLVRDKHTDKWVVKTDGVKNKYRYRYIPICDKLCELLLSKPRNGEYIFASPKGKAYDPNNWKKRVYDKFMLSLHEEYPNIPILNPHELRHTATTIWHEKEVDLLSISKMLGHADLTMLSKRYCHVNVETLRKAINNNLFP